MSEEEAVEFLSSTVNGITQHFWVGGTVTFDPKPWVNSEAFLITALFEPDQIEVTGAGQVVKMKIEGNSAVKVLTIPDEAKATTYDKGQIAPFMLKDDYDYADSEMFWQYIDATTAARLFCEENEHDCEVVNAYGNDVEYFEYEEPESEEEYDPDEEEEEVE